MNLFCFTLGGSTESKTLKEAVPKCQCSPALLRRRPERGSSDPCINSSTPESKRISRRCVRSCVPTSTLDDETLEEDINHGCWVSSGERKDIHHHRNDQNRARRPRAKEPHSDRRQTDLPAQGNAIEAGAAELMRTTGRLRKLQKLVQGMKEAGKEKNVENNDVLNDDSPVIPCIGLGKRTDKTSYTNPDPSPRQQQNNDTHEGPEEGGLLSQEAGNHPWSPFEAWTPSCQTCHPPQREPWVCGGTLSQRRTAEWDRFERLMEELDRKQVDPEPPPRIITDLHFSLSPSSRCGRFDAFKQCSPLMTPRDDGSSLQKHTQNDPTTPRSLGKKMVAVSQITSKRTDRTHGKAQPEEKVTAIIDEDTKKDEADKGEVVGGRPFATGHQQSSNSLESLHSLTSGQSSSSGVTSGSNCSSNRGSLRLEDDSPHTPQFCGRARVHTEFVPSPYDTESLQLKVGDVIDITSKPAMGIWTGLLNGRIGNFKFIYVDVLTEEAQTHSVRQKCRPTTLQQAFKCLTKEDCSTSSRLNDDHALDDLMRLTELNVTDPQQKHRQLTALHCLQQTQPGCQLKNETNQGAERRSEKRKTDMKNCPRDSGCHMMSDSPENSREDTETHSPTTHLHTMPAETMAT